MDIACYYYSYFYNAALAKSNFFLRLSFVEDIMELVNFDCAFTNTHCCVSSLFRWSSYTRRSSEILTPLE